MKTSFSADEVLLLPLDSKPARLLAASEYSLAEVLRLYVGQSGIDLAEHTDCFSFASAHLPPGSCILKTAWSPSTADALIDRELARFSALGLPVEWYLFGSAHALDLAQRLKQRGFISGSSRWMIADLAALPPAPPRPADLRISEVQSSSEMADWSEAFERGFGTTQVVTALYREAYVAAPRCSERVEGRVHRVAYAGNTAVACSTLLLAGGIATLWDVTTVPEFRRRGYAGCLVREDLDHAIRAGYAHATLNSSRAAHSLYEKLGFGIELWVPEFDWRPPNL
jgi:ribosomal protein S18 acetylase RimI-like enzyme